MSKNSKRKKLYRKPEIHKVKLTSPEDTSAVVGIAVPVGIGAALATTSPVKS